ncbi:RnfABCDGE type electron transport complex subunit G [Clostridium sp. Marseille-P299]|uniref:RnfABCDGE type electron transport complex subunit G n=1 Tax=Clostridium sp. Marseille-P299 TaxID=1805477 RepID=UPI00082B86CB|nr:RnfABCDGE type electron transport complex subunit G [Clostridium sp. Marseille-P299]
MQNKSSILKDAFALFMITLVAALALGFVNEITKDPIARQKAKAKSEAYQTVYQEASMVDVENEDIKSRVETSEQFLADQGITGATIDEAGIAKDANDNAIGYVMTITSKKGYGGDITFTMGYTADGMVTAIEILSMNETAGLGDRAKEDSFKGQFANKKVDSFNLTKSGAQAENDIDAISSATVTSTAVTDAVNAGIAFASDLLENKVGGVSHE